MVSFWCPFSPEVYFLSFSPLRFADLRWSIHWFHCIFQELKHWSNAHNLMLKKLSEEHPHPVVMGAPPSPRVWPALLFSFAFFHTSRSGPPLQGPAACNIGLLMDLIRVWLSRQNMSGNAKRIETSVSALAAMISTSRGIIFGKLTQNWICRVGDVEGNIENVRFTVMAIVCQHFHQSFRRRGREENVLKSTLHQGKPGFKISSTARRAKFSSCN